MIEESNELCLKIVAYARKLVGDAELDVMVVVSDGRKAVVRSNMSADEVGRLALSIAGKVKETEGGPKVHLN